MKKSTTIEMTPVGEPPTWLNSWPPPCTYTSS